MAELATSLVAGGFALGGVLVAQFGSRVLDTGKWRRDWIAARVLALRDFYAQVVEAMNAQAVVVGLCALAVKGLGPVVEVERVREADQQWRRVLSLGVLTATGEVQMAMRGFDDAREVAVKAVNSGVWVTCDKGLAELEAARVAVLNCMNEDVASFNNALAQYVIPGPVRWWRRLRRKPLVPE